jgi:Tol biopolymer transport system component
MAVPPAEATFPGRSGKIAFSRLARPFDFDRETIWTVDPRTSRERRLTRPGRRCRRSERWSDTYPSFSPSGRRIAFLHDDDCGAGKRDGIYVMRADGSRRRLLVRTRRGESPRDDLFLASPVFSPGGRRVAFIRDFFGPSGETRTVYTVSASPGKKDRRVPVPFTEGSQFGPIEKISWGPARAIALNIEGRLRFVRGDGSGSRELMPGLAPDWSPSASSVAFSRHRIVCQPDAASGGLAQPPRALKADEGCAGPELNLGNDYIVRRSGRRLRHLTSRGFNVNPVWSPGSRHVAFIDFDQDILYAVSLKSGRRRVVARRVDSLGGLSWQALPAGR